MEQIVEKPLEVFRELAPGLWVAERPQRILGLEIGTRMTAIRLNDGSLFLHSPVALGWQTIDELNRLGRVKAIAAPNRFHHLYVQQYLDHYPEARVYAAPGLALKRKDVAFHGSLGDTAPPEWAGEIEQLVFRSVPLFNEVVFFHPRTRTLILTDLAFNMHASASLLTRLTLQLDGIFGRFGVGWIERRLVRDKTGARRDTDRMLAWDFDRIIVAHGNIVETGGKDVLREAFSWLA